MDILNRSLAPIPQEAWSLIDEEARELLSLKLTGRKVVDFVGPKGIDFGVVNTGRLAAMKNKKPEGVNYFKRVVLPLIEVKVPFEMNRAEIEALVRGAVDIETDSLMKAASNFAEAENMAIFNGLEEANINGIIESSSQITLEIEENKNKFISAIARGIKNMNDEGVDGPYNLLLGQKMYSLVYELDDQGYPLLNKLQNLIEGEILSVPTLDDKGLLLSDRGGDFELIVGQDASIGYSQHKDEEIEFFILETFTFRCNTPEAAVILK